jgi:hypothetical protein
MGAIGIKILEILRKLYGKEFVSKTIGTRANVVKPKELDTNAPTKNIYSKDAFRDSKLQSIVDEKIQEYAPFIFSNRNTREQMNFLENAEQLLKQKKKDFGVTEQLESVKKQKPEAEVLDIKTGKKAEGIETLKEDLGLPPEVDPTSQMGKALLESKRTFKAMDDEIDDSGTLGKAVDAFFGTKDTTRSFLEGRRRPIIRQILAEEPTIRKNLSEDDYDGLLFGTDLDKGADASKDPFAYLNKYFIRDEDQLDVLDDIIDEMPSSTPAEISAEFKKRTGGLKPKDKDLGDKLKDLPDDIPDMAEGGRIGYAVGTGLKIYKFFKSKGKNLTTEIKKAVDDIFPSGDNKLDADRVVDNMLEDLDVDRDMFDQKDIIELYGMAYDTIIEGSVPKGLAGFMSKKGKGKIKMADEVVVPDEVQTKKELRQLADEDPMNFVKTVTPKFYERMELKIKYPGITDDLIEKIMVDDNPQRKAEVLAAMDETFKMMDKGMSSDEILNTIKKTPRTKQAGGGLSYLMGM